jgi:hypothetical protein
MWFTTSQSLKVTVKYPDDEDINAEQLNYIKNFTNSFENVLFSSNFADAATGYRNRVDTASLINWYIASELTGNPDCFWSTYIYKKRDIDKFFFGPLWDYDIAFNNDNRLGDAVHKLMRDNAFNPRTWMQRFWQDDWFRLSVNRRWTELVEDGLLDKIQAYIDTTVAAINISQQQNFAQWNVLNKRIYNEQFLFPTYQQGVDYLRTYLNNRVDFLTNSFAATLPEVPSPSFEAEDFYYRIINHGTNNAIDVSNNSLTAQENLLMWSPEEDDYSQQWKIEMPGTGIFRIVNRRSGLAMTGNGRSQSLIQTDINISNTAQQWKITPVFTGDRYGLENVASGYSANNSGGGTANGTAVIEYDNNILNESKKNQHWYIQKVERIDNTTSIAQVNNDPKVRIFPNPATDYIRIEAVASSHLFVNIYRIDGRCIYVAQFGENKYLDIRLEEAGIQTGIYVIKVGNSASKLIVK